MDVRTYPHAERPDVEVLVDDTWHPGELRAWERRADGWRADVLWHRGMLSYLDTVPAGRVQEVGRVSIHTQPHSASPIRT